MQAASVRIPSAVGSDHRQKGNHVEQWSDAAGQTQAQRAIREVPSIVQWKVW
jgi:hypothetical protein